MSPFLWFHLLVFAVNLDGLKMKNPGHRKEPLPLELVLSDEDTGTLAEGGSRV